MNSKIEITNEKEGNSIKITSECQTVQELKDVLRECRDQIPRKKIFGVF